jgi:acetolactate synthase-1/2/3 large subunit
MGPMGFAVCAVIGAKIGCPDHTCIAIVGDGAFLMHGNEVSTASRYRIGAIWIILYDNSLSMVTQGMEHFDGDKTDPMVWAQLYDLGNPDLMLYAKSMGAHAYCINSPSELEVIMPKVLERANVDCIPQVVVVNINRQAIPPYYNPIYGPKLITK